MKYKLIGFKDECGNNGIYNNYLDYNGGASEADELIEAINDAPGDEGVIEVKTEFDSVEDAYSYVKRIARCYYAAYRAYLLAGGYEDAYPDTELVDDEEQANGLTDWDMDLNYTMYIRNEDTGEVEEIELPECYARGDTFRVPCRIEIDDDHYQD